MSIAIHKIDQSHHIKNSITFMCCLSWLLSYCSLICCSSLIHRKNLGIINNWYLFWTYVFNVFKVNDSKDLNAMLFGWWMELSNLLGNVSGEQKKPHNWTQTMRTFTNTNFPTVKPVAQHTITLNISIFLCCCLCLLPCCCYSTFIFFFCAVPSVISFHISQFFLVCCCYFLLCLLLLYLLT